MTGPVTRVPPLARSEGAWRGAGLSHRGCLREANEDAILAGPDDGALWAVADGMGGHGHGEIAAARVIARLAELRSHPVSAEAVSGAIAAANRDIRTEAAARGVAQMGATVVAALVESRRARIAWAGDSRAYLHGATGLARLTRDHSVVQELIDRGVLRPEDAEGHPEAHVVTRAVGAAPAVDLAWRATPLAPGDRLLLCSDGLTACVSEAEIARLIASEPEPAACCRRLVEAALARGAPDNVSVVVVRVDAPGLGDST